VASLCSVQNFIHVIFFLIFSAHIYTTVISLLSCADSGSVFLYLLAAALYLADSRASDSRFFPHCADYKLDYYYYFSSLETFLLISSSFVAYALIFSFMTVGFIAYNGKAKFML